MANKKGFSETLFVSFEKKTIYKKLSLLFDQKFHVWYNNNVLK
jgi:hypothetical protein